MRIYETTFIVNPQSDDSTIESKVKAVTDLIANNGGKIINENRIGTRRMAYAIKRLTQGYYTSLIFKAEPVILPELERMYKLDEAFLRYLTIIYEGNIKELLGPAEEAPAAETEKKEVKPEDSDHLRGRREEAITKEEPEVEEEKKEVEEKPVEEAPAPVMEKEETPEVVESSETEERTKLTSPEDDEL